MIVLVTGMLLAMSGVSCRNHPQPESATPATSGEQTTALAELTSFSQEITAPPAQAEAKTLKRSATFELDITVRNTGTQPWVGSGPDRYVAAGYRWMDVNGTLLPLEGRAQLKREVQPGQSEQLKLAIQAPDVQGQYKLIVSMVQEHVAWFFYKGAKGLEIPVTVLP
jgi:hypothetical protein